MKVLITCSGTGSRMGNYTKYTNKALVKIGDKFSIDYIIENYNKLDDVEFVITLGYFGDQVKQYLTLAYPNLKFNFVKVDKYEGEGSSQGYSILQAEKFLNEPFIFIACDTIILDDMYDSSINSFSKNNYRIDCNKIYLYKYSDSTNYTSVKCDDQRITSIHDKGETNFDFIYLGKCQIFDYESFWKILNETYKKNKFDSSIGDVNVYQQMIDKKITFEYKIINNWYDAGTIGIFDQDINKKCKYNVLTKYDESISFLKDKVVKFFYNKEKNLKRVERVKFLNNLGPKILNYSDNFHTMEKIDSKPISEIYQDNIIYNLLNWTKKNLWIKKETPENFSKILHKFYYSKTIERIDKCKKLNLQEFNIINGVDVGNILDLINKIDFEYLCKSEATSFHGDFILDNILMKNNDFVLIDWREDFGGDLENGDIYYDLAKLKHNIHLNHSNLEKELFCIKKVNEDSCIVDIKCNYFLINQLKKYDKFVEENNLDSKKINILMSLIWINMAPLHEYPLNNFLLNFGKYNLHLTLVSSD